MRGAIGYQQADEKFTRILKARLVLNNQTCEKLSKKVGGCKKTIVTKINNPSRLTVEELRNYTKALDIEPEELLFLIYGKSPTE